MNCATGSGSADNKDGDEDARRGWRSTTVILHPDVSETGDVGGGGSGSELGVTIATLWVEGLDRGRRHAQTAPVVGRVRLVLVRRSRRALREQHPQRASRRSRRAPCVCRALRVVARDGSGNTCAGGGERHPAEGLHPAQHAAADLDCSVAQVGLMFNPNFAPAPSGAVTGMLVCACPGLAAGEGSYLVSGET